MRNPFDISPSAPQFVNGLRECRTNLYTYNTFPQGLIGPVTIIWRCSSESQPKSNLDKWEELAQKIDKEKRTQKESRVAEKQARQKAALEAANTADRAAQVQSAQSPQCSPTIPQHSPPQFSPASLLRASSTTSPQLRPASPQYSHTSLPDDRVHSQPVSQNMVDESTQIRRGPNAALWIVCHSLIADQVEAALRDTIGALERRVRTIIGLGAPSSNCRFHKRDVNIFRLVGPKAAQQVAKVLTAADGTTKAKREVRFGPITTTTLMCRQFLTTLPQADVTIPELILSLRVTDPRITSVTTTLCMPKPDTCEALVYRHIGNVRPLSSDQVSLFPMQRPTAYGIRRHHNESCPSRTSIKYGRATRAKRMRPVMACCRKKSPCCYHDLI